MKPDAAGKGDASAGKTAPTEEVTKVVAKKKVKVGLLLPFTGRNAALGRSLQDAATVSLFDKYARLSTNQQEIQVELIAKDTGDAPEYAREAMTQALDAGAELIIGPVFSDATEVAAPIARARDISVISFSNNQARAVPGLYMLGFSPTEQTQRIVTYALQNNRTRIAVLVPRTPLGEQVLEAARATVNKAGFDLTAESTYAPQAIGVEEAINRLIPPGEERGFDSILLAEGGVPLETVMRALQAKGITPGTVQFLGTGIWDDVALLREVNLDGAWFASSSPYNTGQFERRFKATYGYMPPRIASLSYDAVALAVTLATSERPYNADNLTVDSGFVGPANGVFRLRPDGKVERGLAVIKIEGSERRVISPAPTGFTK